MAIERLLSLYFAYLTLTNCYKQRRMQIVN